MMMGHRDMAFRQETSKPKSVSATLGRFWQYFKHYWIILLGVITFVLLGVYMQVLVPDMIGQAIDCYIAPAAQAAASGASNAARTTNCWYAAPNPQATQADRVAGLGGLVLVLIGLYIGGSVVQGAQIYMMTYAGQKVLFEIRTQVFRHIHRLSLGYYTRHEAGDVMSRITNDSDTIQQVVGFPLIGVIQGVLTIIWIAINMIAKSPGYALISLATAPVMLVATIWFSTQARNAFRKVRREVGNVNASLQEGFAAVREVQAFGRENESIKQFADSNAATRDANIRAVAFTSGLQPTLEALGYVSIALVSGVGGILLLGGGDLFGTTLSLGLIVTFINYSQRLAMPISQISVMWANVQSAIAGGERIFGFLDQVPDMQDRAGAKEMPAINGLVEFDVASAEYEPGQRVLCDVSLSAQPGQTIAIVGPTGAGKTTIINLIPRFYDVVAGEVRIDGIDVRDVTMASLRKQIGIVLQDSFLFSDTVMNNIRYGRPEATDAEVIEAAKLARAHEFIERLQQGYQTMLGERGAGLSQGQRQLISIARAALANPRILILDEATSSVDTRTERLIQKALEELMRGRTSFVIAHRLSTIRHANQVLVLKDGEIIERGTHTELLKQNGFYHDLYMSQFRRDIDFSLDEVSPTAANAPVAAD